MGKVKKHYFKNCETCGKEIKVWNWQLKRKWGRYCSKKCAGKRHRGETERHRRGTEKRYCKVCKAEFWVQQARIKKRQGIYCSKSCRAKDLTPEQEGIRNWNWKGGKWFDKTNGYVFVWTPEKVKIGKKEPRIRHRYLPEHRLVMEKYLERKLNPWEFIHHKNGIKNDNRLENLELMTKRVHQGKVLCPYCNKEFLIR